MATRVNASSDQKVLPASAPTEEEIALQRIAEQVATLKAKVDTLSELTNKKTLNPEDGKQRIADITTQFQKLQDMILEDDWIVMDEKATQPAQPERVPNNAPRPRRITPRLDLEIRAIFTTFTKTVKTCGQLIILPAVMIITCYKVMDGFGRAIGGCHQ
jgi:hypothetical protein